MTMQDNKAALLVGICDDEEHIHRTVEDMLSLYAESNQITRQRKRLVKRFCLLFWRF